MHQIAGHYLFLYVYRLGSWPMYGACHSNLHLMMQLELHYQLYRFVSCCIFNLFVIDIDLKSVRRVWDVFQWQMRNFFIRKSRKPKHRYTSDLLSFCDAFIRLVALFVYLFAER